MTEQQRQRRCHRHTKGSYHSSAATAETLGTDDTLATNEIDMTNTPVNTIEIEGLELLLQHHLSLDRNQEDDQDDDDDDQDQEIITHDTEIDSLVLARRRLRRIWIHRPLRRRSQRKYITDPEDSIKLARRRIPQCIHRQTKLTRPPRHLPPRREWKMEVTFPDLDPLELTPSDNDDDDTDYSWDSLADKTVDSLELTRKRMEKLQQDKNRRRKYGTDLLYLGRRHQKLIRDQPLGFIPTRFQAVVPLRQHSDGVVKLKSAYQASQGLPTRTIPKMARHNSDGWLRAGRAA